MFVLCVYISYQDKNKLFSLNTNVIQYTDLTKIISKDLVLSFRESSRFITICSSRTDVTNDHLAPGGPFIPGMISPGTEYAGVTKG